MSSSKGGSQQTKFIAESDLYRLILRSKAPNAESFQDWVCEEVLPAIRRKGAYSLGDMPRSYPEAMQRIGELVMQGRSYMEALHLVLPSGEFGERSPKTGEPKTRLISSHYRTPRNGLPDAGALRLQQLQLELFPLATGTGTGKGAR